ncbi:SDR family NAD(P)-dependent oxidoreductase [Azotobacter salinestris]|uniref:SDR family NAD(P)-dependent oxidoreductase n=1 Tax=Azotobacter salinestris TaxID=69964 RepID=UPI001AD6AC42|nr:SDR family oxidoreductase [Azotobacter salinestris]
MLDGKVAVVTGGGSGIGEAIVRLFVAEGARVVIGDIDASAAALAAELGEAAIFVRADVTCEESVAALMQAAVDGFGRLDILVANAGIPEKKAPVHQLDLANWQRVIDIDLTGVALCNKHAATRMLEGGGGAIVNMASILAHVGQENSTAYSAAKAAVVNFTRSVALTYARQGIRANSVSPGYIDTPLLARLPQATREAILARQPVGRLAQPLEIAQGQRPGLDRDRCLSPGRRWLYCDLTERHVGMGEVPSRMAVFRNRTG